MSELDTFRAETRAWLEANTPQGVRNLPQSPEYSCWGGRKWAFRDDDQRLWLERMAERGWTVPDWPKAYGGGGLSKDQARVLDQEMKRVGARRPLDSLGIWMLGPALMKFGSEAQKLEHLPRIARGEIRWAQGYSEPGAGSDLASVATKAVEDGDDFVVNGSKIWTTYGDKCDMIFALVRSEPDAPKHLGISFLLIDMDQPGVTTSPIKMISGESHFTSTFFDNARAPKSNVVGERGRGWDVTKYLLSHEREMIGSQPVSSNQEGLAARARRVLGERMPASLKADIVQCEMDAWVMGIAVERTRDQAKARQGSPFVASVLKTAGTELARRKAELVMTVDALDSFEIASRPAYDWLLTPATTIAGGSNEVQLNILAKRALDLPGA
jgi:acyl-CoA dehydrogenase